MRLFFALLVGLTGAGVLAWLGTWQLERLYWKEAVLAEIDSRITAAPVAVPATPDPARDRYLPVTAAGVLGDRMVRVLVSQKQIGAGYRIIQPLDTGNRVLLLDRGFIATDRAVPVNVGQSVRVTGNLHWPDEMSSSTPAPDRAANIWFARDVALLARELDTEPVLIVAREIVPAAPPLAPLPVASAGIPNDHLQYALTWFGLAIVWLGMTFYYLFRTRRRPKG